MSEFFNMGGYGAFVWSAFGVATVILAWIAMASWRAVGVHQKVLNDLEARVPRRRRTNGDQGRDNGQGPGT